MWFSRSDSCAFSNLNLPLGLVCTIVAPLPSMWEVYLRRNFNDASSPVLTDNLMLLTWKLCAVNCGGSDCLRLFMVKVVLGLDFFDYFDFPPSVSFHHCSTHSLSVINDIYIYIYKLRASLYNTLKSCYICRRRSSFHFKFLYTFVVSLCLTHFIILNWHSFIDHSSRGVLPTVALRCVWSRNLEWRG